MKQLPFEYRVVSSLEGHHVVLIRDGTPTMWQLIATFPNKDRAADYADLEEQMARDWSDDPEGPWRYDAVAAEPIVPPEPPSAIKPDDVLSRAKVEALVWGAVSTVDEQYKDLPATAKSELLDQVGPLLKALSTIVRPSPQELGPSGPLPPAKIDYLLAERAAPLTKLIEAAEPTTCLDPQPLAEESEVVPHSAVPCVGDNAGAAATEREPPPDAPEPLQASAEAAVPEARTEVSAPTAPMGRPYLAPGEAERRASVVLEAIRQMTAAREKITCETLIERTGLKSMSTILAGLRANGLITMHKGRPKSEEMRRFGGIRLAPAKPDAQALSYAKPSAPPIPPKPKPTVQTFKPTPPRDAAPIPLSKEAEEQRIVDEYVRKNGVTKIGPLSTDNPNVDEVMAAVRVDGAEVVPVGQGFMRFSVNRQPPIDRETLLSRANRTRIANGMPVWDYGRVKWKRPEPEPVLYNGVGNAAQKAAAKAKAAKASATP